VNWIAAAPFEAMITVDSGGADLVTIPAGAVLENVAVPPEPTWNDPDAGFRPVDFFYQGVPHTATVFDFFETGECHES
jgi:hypothetical protein